MCVIYDLIDRVYGVENVYLIEYETDMQDQYADGMRGIDFHTTYLQTLCMKHLTKIREN